MIASHFGIITLMLKRSGGELVKAVLTDVHFWLPVAVALIGIALLVMVGRL